MTPTNPTPYLIAERPPEFPCEMLDNNLGHWFRKEVFPDAAPVGTYTLWRPLPTAPTFAPDAGKEACGGRCGDRDCDLDVEGQPLATPAPAESELTTDEAMARQGAEEIMAPNPPSPPPTTS